MGLFSNLLRGGAALNVLGGMAQQYNKISDERRAEAFEEAQAEKKFANEEGLIRLRTKLENEGALNRTIEKAKIDQQTKLNVQKLKLKEAQTKNRPKGTAISFKQYFPQDSYFADEFLVPKRSDYDANTYFNDLRNRFKPEFWDKLSDSPLYTRTSPNLNYKNDVNSLADTVVNAGLETLEVVQQRNEAGDKVSDIRIMNPGILEYFNSNPILQEAFKRKYPKALDKIKKELTDNIGDGGSVSGIKQETDGSAKITYTTDDRYFKTNDPNVKKNKQMVERQIQSLNHPLLANLNVPERMGKLDTMMKFEAPELYKNGNGGEFILNAVSKLTPKLNTYTKTLQDVNNKREIKDFFENDEIGKQLATNPNLAIQVIAMSLPPSIKGTVDFKPLAGGLVGNQLYSETQDFKILQEKNERVRALANANKQGFKNIESRNYKQNSLRQALLPARELIKLIKGPKDERAYLGANKTFFDAWMGAKEQFNGFIDATKEQINAGKGLFTPQAVKELRKLEEETDNFLKQANDTSLSEKARNSALFNYYAGVLTFTMAASVQGGADGAVDSRTISDKDVQLWKTILNLGTFLAQRDPTQAILEAIVTDAEIKIQILEAMGNNDDRIKSAAKIANKGFYGDVSISSYQNLQNNYGKDIEDITQIKAGDAINVTYSGTSLSQNNNISQGSIGVDEGTRGLGSIPSSGMPMTAREKALMGNQ